MSKNDPTDDDNKPLVKARHDNSVLFSLKDLDSGGAPKKGEDGATGAAQNDSSGFINLNAIAASSQYVAESGDDGASAGGGAQVVPAMVPMGRPKENKGVLYAIIAAVVLLLLVVAALVVVLLTSEPKTTTIVKEVAVPAAPPAADGDKPTNAVAADDKDKDKDKDKDDEEEKEDEEGKDDEVAEDGEKAADDGGDSDGKKIASAGNAKKPTGGSGGAADKEDEKADEGGEDDKAEPPASDAAPAKKKPSGNINDILNDLSDGKADGAGKNDGNTGGTPAPAGKTELTRADVKNTVAKYGSRISACGGPGKTGVVLVRFSVQPTGSVGSASVTGDKAGSAEGNCVAAAVRGFKFPAFSGAPKTITYPFRL